MVVEFEILKNDDPIYADNDDLQLFIMGPVALFSDARLATSSGKHLETVIYTKQSPLINKLFKPHRIIVLL